MLWMVLVLLASLTAGLAAEPPPAEVLVTELPHGEREVVGVSGFGGHALRLSSSGEVISWTDPAGNVHISSPGSQWDIGKLYALEVLESGSKNPRLFPAEKARLDFKAISPKQMDLTVTRSDGIKLTYAVEPEKVGIRVEGQDKAYLIRGRIPCRAEGCRIVSPATTLFPSAELGKVEGSPQLLVDAQRTRAFSLIVPKGASVSWRLTQTDGWSWVKEHLTWQVELKPGETLWMSSSPVPEQSGSLKVGLYRRHLFRPSGEPLVIATLSSSRLIAEMPATITLSKPLEELTEGGVLLAALIPVVPDDPVEASEQGAWFTRFDQYGSRMLPLVIQQVGKNEWKVAPTKTTPAGLYRLRLWIAPKDAPRPEALGGPKYAVVGYFPGFDGRGNATFQQTPIGDVLVMVGEEAAGSITVLNPALRESFWRGEKVLLLLQVRGSINQVKARVNVRHDECKTTVASLDTTIPLKDSFGLMELLLSTAALAPGSYTVEVEASAPGFRSYPFKFTVSPPPSWGMLLFNSGGTPPCELEAHERLGVNAWVDIMPFPSAEGFTPRWPSAAPTARGIFYSQLSLPIAPVPPAGIYDALVRGNWMMLQGIQSRQISFGIHHSIPEHVEETLRKHLIYAQFGRRFPSTLGLVFDYDLLGATAAYLYAEPYRKAWERRMAILTKRREEAWEGAKKRGATDEEKGRFLSLFHAGVIAEIYRQSISNLHAALPEQRHTSSPTADHNYIQEGQYLPVIYHPLDFRYLEVWNDQIYPNSAHDMQESFWVSLLRMEKPAGQPLWITVPTAPQPGTHFRRSLEAIARGANAIGYNGEGGAGMSGGWGIVPTESNVRTVQETLSGKLAKMYGSWFNQFEPDEKVGILYSVSQGGTNFGQSSPIFFAYYTLAQINRPARLLTEEEISNGALKSVDALIIVRQSAKMPDATLKAIESFAADGGKVICDKDTTLKIQGAVKLDSVSFPGGLWPNGGNTFHKIIQSFPEKMGQTLKDALGDAGRQPLESPDGSALVATKRAPGALLVFVTNNHIYPFEALFTEEQRKSSFFREFMWRGWTYYKDVRVPCKVVLTLRNDLVANPPKIYDVFAGKELKIERAGQTAFVTVDLATMLGRVLLLSRKPLTDPVVYVGARHKSDSLVSIVVKSDIPLPIRVRVNGQTVYRAATPQGSCDTFAICQRAKDVEVEVTELITGKIQRFTLPFVSSALQGSSLRQMPTVQVWDLERIRKVLNSKELAVYVDARQANQLEAAQNLARQLGSHTTVVFNPPILDYPVAWDSPKDEEESKERIRSQKLLAWRRPAEPYLQWTGAMVPSAVWNRPVLLFGNALNNRLIADLNSVTLLSRPALPELIGPGRAVIQPVAGAFWNGNDAVVVLCSDEEGMSAAFDKLVAIASGHDVENALSFSDDGGARADRFRVLGFEPPVYPKSLIRLSSGAVSSRPQHLFKRADTSLQPMLPVCALSAIKDGVIVALHSPGRNLVRLNAKGRVVWQKMTAGFYQPTAALVNEMGEAVVSDGAFLWRHSADGNVRWKMLASPVRAPEEDGSVWVLEGETLSRISPAGQIIETVKLPAPLVALSNDARIALVQREGPAGYEKSEASLVALEIQTGKEIWVVRKLLVAEARLSEDGKVIGCIEHENMAGRDDLDRSDASRLCAIEFETGRILMRRPLGESMTNLHITRDGKRIIAAGSGFSDLLYIADVNANIVRRVKLPERGAWARALSLDNKELWVACERLYRLDLDSLTLTLVLNKRIICLTPKQGGGMLAGTTDGKVLWLDRNGRIEREAVLAQGIAVQDILRELAPLRDAPLVGSSRLKPHEVPSTFALGPEYHLDFMRRGDAAVIRGDGILPLQTLLRIPEKGRYRFTIDLGNSKEQGEQMHFMQIIPEGKPGVAAVPVNGNKWKQVVELELDAGIHELTIAPVWGWKVDPVLCTLTVEKADK